MKLKWTDSALFDLLRLEQFVQANNARAAQAAKEYLTSSIQKLTDTPRLGTPMPRYVGSDVRRLITRDYEIRYRVTTSAITILRIYHTREQR